MQPRNGLSGGFTDSHIRRHLYFELWEKPGESTKTHLRFKPAVRRGSVEDDRRRSSEIVSWMTWLGGLGEECGLRFFWLVCLFGSFKEFNCCTFSAFTFMYPLFLLCSNRFSDGRLGIDNKKRVWGSEGCSRWPYSCRLQPFELFFRVFQAGKAKPEVGVERRGEVKTTDFDQINEKRSLVTNKMQQNASISDSCLLYTSDAADE